MLAISAPVASTKGNHEEAAHHPHPGCDRDRGGQEGPRSLSPAPLSIVYDGPASGGLVRVRARSRVRERVVEDGRRHAEERRRERRARSTRRSARPSLGEQVEQRAGDVEIVSLSTNARSTKIATGRNEPRTSSRLRLGAWSARLPSATTTGPVTTPHANDHERRGSRRRASPIADAELVDDRRRCSSETHGTVRRNSRGRRAARRRAGRWRRSSPTPRRGARRRAARTRARSTTLTATSP